MLSRSRIMYLGVLSHGNALTTCWAVQAALGLAVTLKCNTRLRCDSTVILHGVGICASKRRETERGLLSRAGHKPR